MKKNTNIPIYLFIIFVVVTLATYYFATKDIYCLAVVPQNHDIKRRAWAYCMVINKYTNKRQYVEWFIITDHEVECDKNSPLIGSHFMYVNEKFYKIPLNLPEKPSSNDHNKYNLYVINKNGEISLKPYKVTLDELKDNKKFKKLISKKF